MSITIMSQVWESNLPPTERFVLMSLADHADDLGRQCYPSIGRIVQRTGFSERTVQGALKRLEGRGILAVEKNAGQGNSNLYTITLPPAGDAPPQEMHPRRRCGLPPQEMRVTPAGDAPKPSITINEPSSNKVRKRAAQFPEDWWPSPETISKTLEKGYDEAQISGLVEDCVNHHRGKGNAFKDHNAAFRMWASNQIKFHGTPEQQRTKHHGKRTSANPELESIARAAGLT